MIIDVMSCITFPNALAATVMLYIVGVMATMAWQMETYSEFRWYGNLPFAIMWPLVLVVCFVLACVMIIMNHWRR